MKPKDAWQNIKDDVEYANLIDNRNYSTAEDIKIIDDLVAKATPMKPYIDDNDFICSGCHGAIVGVEDAYCSECGQKLDWSDEK